MKKYLFAFVFLSAAQAQARPPDVGPMPILKFNPPKPERRVLSNGVTVYLIEDHELPLLSMSLRLRTTPADEPEEKAGLFSLMGQVWRAGGTSARTPDALNETLERMASNIETSVGYEVASVSLDTLSKNTTASFEIFSDVVFHPRFDEAQITLAKGKMLEGIRRKNDDPANIGRRAFRDTAYGEHHIYARESDEKSLEKLNRRALADLHRRIVVPDGAILTVAGDFKTAELVAQLETLFKDWKPTGRTVAPYDYAVKDAKPGVLFHVQKNITQSRVTFGRIGVSRHSPDHFTLTVADYILGGGGTSRLFAQIRSRLGLAYVVGSFFSEPNGPGIIGLGAQTKAASTWQLIEALRAELEKFCAAPPNADEMRLAKESIINSFVFHFDSPAEVAAQKADLEYFNYPDDYLDTYLNHIRAVSPADVLKAARAYYYPQGMKVLVVGDQDKFGKKLGEAGQVIEIPLEKIR